MSSRIWRSSPTDLSDSRPDIHGGLVGYVTVDEVRVLDPAHVGQLARVADDLGLDVFATRRTSVRGFPGVRPLIELADRTETLRFVRSVTAEVRGGTGAGAVRVLGPLGRVGRWGTA